MSRQSICGMMSNPNFFLQVLTYCVKDESITTGVLMGRFVLFGVIISFTGMNVLAEKTELQLKIKLNTTVFDNVE